MKFRPASILAALVVASCANGNPSPQVAATPPKSRAPQVEVLPPASLRLVQEASTSERHYAVDGLDLPADGREVSLTCRIIRARGVPYMCLVPDNSPLLEARLVGAADRRIAEMRFDPALLEPSKTTTAVADITVRLSPQDRRILSAPSKVHPPGNAKWERQPDESAIVSALWTPWRTGIKTNHIEARMRCEIQTDLSVICADVRVVPDTVAPSQLNALRLGTYYRSEARLADGSPAAGAWVEIAIAADEPPVAIAPAPPRQ